MAEKKSKAMKDNSTVNKSIDIMEDQIEKGLGISPEKYPKK